MAIIDWPLRLGYAEFVEMPHRMRGPHIHRSVYDGTPHISYGGGTRRRGHITTQVSSATGAVQPAITALVHSLTDANNQLRLTRPDDPTGDKLLVQVLRIDPPERDDRGIWRGWRLEFIEYGTTALRSYTGDIVGTGDTDRYAVVTEGRTRVTIRLTGMVTGDEGDIGFEFRRTSDDVRLLGRNTASGADLSGTVTVIAGTYYILVGVDTDVDTDTPYTLTVLKE